MVQIVIALVAAAMLYGAGFGTGWKIDTWKHTSDMVAQLKAAQDKADQEREFRLTVSNQFQTQLSKLRVTNTTIHQEVVHEVEKAVYVDPNCNLPATGVSLRNAAIDAANGVSAGGPDTALPADRKDGAGKASLVGRLLPSGSHIGHAVR